MTYRFQFRRYRLPLRTPIRTAHGIWTVREGGVIRLEDQHGRCGYGEAAPLAGFGPDTIDDIATVCTGWGPRVTTEALMAGSGHRPCLRAAVTAAQEALAEPEKGFVPVAPDYRAVAALLPAGAAARPVLRDRIELGYRVFKWKVGVGDPATERGLLDELCADLPEGSRLRLDANGAWDRREAERWLDRCADRPIEFVEQPVASTARGAADLLQGLAADYPTALALDESLAIDSDVARWLGAGWRGVFVIKPALLADATGVVQTLARARAQVVFSSALETALGAQVALRHAFGWPGEKRALGFGVWPLYADPRFDGPPAAPFIAWSDVQRIQPEAIWNALS